MLRPYLAPEAATKPTARAPAVLQFSSSVEPLLVVIAAAAPAKKEATPPSFVFPKGVLATAPLAKAKTIEALATSPKKPFFCFSSIYNAANLSKSESSPFFSFFELKISFLFVNNGSTKFFI